MYQSVEKVTIRKPSSPSKWMFCFNVSILGSPWEGFLGFSICSTLWQPSIMRDVAKFLLILEALTIKWYYRVKFSNRHLLHFDFLEHIFDELVRFFSVTLIFVCLAKIQPGNSLWCKAWQYKKKILYQALSVTSENIAENSLCNSHLSVKRTINRIASVANAEMRFVNAKKKKDSTWY